MLVEIDSVPSALTITHVTKNILNGKKKPVHESLIFSHRILVYKIYSGMFLSFYFNYCLSLYPFIVICRVMSNSHQSVSQWDSQAPSLSLEKASYPFSMFLGCERLTVTLIKLDSSILGFMASVLLLLVRRNLDIMSIFVHEIKNICSDLFLSFTAFPKVCLY